MLSPLHAWDDTLIDLGVMGLIPSNTKCESNQKELSDSQDNESLVTSSFVKSDITSCNMTDLEVCVHNCLACPLGSRRICPVFGEGSGRNGLMFIGEGPGRDEDLKGRPFVGRSGELLDKMCVAIKIERSDSYITNIVKCRPPDNRVPTRVEVKCCLPYLKRQIELVRPKVIVTLGATPLRELLGIQIGITKVRGQWQRLDMFGGISVMPTFHPAYVLRQYTRDVRQAVWDDLVAAKKWLDENI
jgi:DNA polymerase